MPIFARIVRSAAVVTLSCSVTCAALLAGRASADAAVAPAGSTIEADTSFSFVSSAGDYVGGGASEHFRKSKTVSVSVTGTTTVVEVVVSAGAERWQATVAAGAGDTLHPGVYSDAERYPFQTGRAPGLSVSGDARGCNRDFGSFAVNQIAFDDGGNLTLADITLVQHCETPSAPPLNATIHYRALPLQYRETSDRGDDIGDGMAKTYLNSTSVLSVAGTVHSLNFQVSGLGDYWFGSVTPPSGQELQAGATYPTERFADPDHAGLDVSADSRGCNTSTGTLTVEQLTVGTDGSISAVRLRFTQHCDGAQPALHGKLRYFA